MGVKEPDPSAVCWVPPLLEPRTQYRAWHGTSSDSSDQVNAQRWEGKREPCLLKKCRVVEGTEMKHSLPAQEHSLLKGSAGSGERAGLAFSLRVLTGLLKVPF